jgi:hypothetical protein
MILSRRSLFSGCSLAIAATIPACEQPQPKNPIGMDFRDTYGPRPRVVKDQAGNLPIAKGKPTLAYMIEFPCTVRVIELDTERPIAQAAAKPGQILSVEKKAGILLDGKVVAPGPLDETLEYGIFCDRKAR